jgi:hypothetical protein
MSSRPPTLVHAAETPAPAAGLVRVESDTTDGLLEAVRAVDDPATVIAAVDRAITSHVAHDPAANDRAANEVAAHDVDELVAVVSVMAVEGVQYFETSMTQPVKRILDTYQSIIHGSIDGLER